MSSRPLDALEASLDQAVTVHLKDGRAYYGVLSGFDQHMNVVLEASPDIVDVEIGEPETQVVEDTTIIRGDNVVTITT